MLSIKDFKDHKIYSDHMVLGGQTSGSGTCNTGNCTGTDCNSYTYTDDCDGNNRVITSECITDGPCVEE